MENKKIIIPFFVILVAGLVAFNLYIVNKGSSSPEFNRYNGYAKTLGTDWNISEDTAGSFAYSNCESVGNGDPLYVNFMSTDHVKSSAAVFAAYCPESFDEFLSSVSDQNPEYSSLVRSIDENIGRYVE